MALKVVGKKYYDFTNKEGQRVQGLKLHCLQEHPTPDEGYLTELVSVGISKPIYSQADSIAFGSIITPVYNRYGSLQDIILVSMPDDKKKASAN